MVCKDADGVQASGIVCCCLLLDDEGGTCDHDSSGLTSRYSTLEQLQESVIWLASFALPHALHFRLGVRTTRCSTACLG